MQRLGASDLLRLGSLVDINYCLGFMLRLEVVSPPSATACVSCCIWEGSRWQCSAAPKGRQADGGIMQQVGDNLYLEKVMCNVSGRSFPAATQKTPATDVCSSGSYVVHYNVD